MRLRSLVLAAAVVAGLAGCGGSASPAARPAAPADQAGGSATPTPVATGSAGAGTRPGGTAAPGASGAPPSGTASAAPGGKTGRPASPPPTPTTAKGVVSPKVEASEDEIPIDAAVTPFCVTPGTTATLTVKTRPNATLVYLAVYKGEKSGAQPPWGEGYGGNDKGETDATGQWQGTWAVRADTPSGKARVLVIVGFNGKQRAINVPFSVGGREAGGCGT